MERFQRNIFENLDEFMADGSSEEDDNSDDEDTVSEYASDMTFSSDPSTSDVVDGGDGVGDRGAEIRTERGRGRGRGARRGGRRGASGGGRSRSRQVAHWQNEEGDEEEWTDNLAGFPSHCPFSGNSGLHIPDDVKTPLDFFNLTWTRELTKFMKKETNRYAREQICKGTDSPQRTPPPF